MKIYRCDRCGKVQEKPFRKEIEISSRNPKDEQLYCVLEEYDLCDDCLEDFYKWVKGENDSFNYDFGDIPDVMLCETTT